MRRVTRWPRRWGMALLAGLALPVAMMDAGVIRAAEPVAALPVAGAAGPVAAPVATYADLVALSDSAPLVLKLIVRRVAPVEPARAPDVRTGWVRLYVEAEPMGVLRGPQVLLPVLRYLLDAPLDARGRPPQLKKQVVLVYARPVEADQGKLQLVAPDAQLPWDAELEARARKVLADLAAPGAPGHVSGVREAMFVPGDLAGAGETQIFLDTQNGTPASITVVHVPGQPARWSASFTEVVDSSGSPPPPETLAWYRLACFLPDTLPDGANVSEGEAERGVAAADYAMVRAGLGACVRVRGQ